MLTEEEGERGSWGEGEPGRKFYHYMEPNSNPLTLSPSYPLPLISVPPSPVRQTVILPVAAALF